MSRKAVVQQEIPEAKIRQAIWMLKQKKTKKSVCEHLGIAYNTKRLDTIIQDFKDKEAREKRLKEKAKNTPLTEADKKSIIKDYLNGEAQSAIAKQFYISPQRVKKVLLENNVPIRSRKKNEPAKTEHIVQDLEIKFSTGEKVFFGELNSFATITEVFDEEYVERLSLGRQRYVETYKWTPKSPHPDAVEGIHYEIYWELEDGTRWLLNPFKAHISRVENLIIETGRETYNVWIEGDYAHRRSFVSRDKLFPVVMK
jgi:hypothetical protein